MSGHTKGPWRVSVIPNLGSGRTATYRLDNLEADAAAKDRAREYGGSFRQFNPEVEYPANACLIAAAPDLLGAAMGALKALESASRQLTDDHKTVLKGKAWGARDIDALRSAIARATEAQP